MAREGRVEGRQDLEGVVDRGRTPGAAAQPAAPSKAPAPLEPAKRIPDDGDDAVATRVLHAVARRAVTPSPPS